MPTRRSIGTLLCAFMLAACQPPPSKPMTPEETQRVQQITQRMTPRCIGRYTVDVPEPFDLHPIQEARIEGVRIEITPMSRSRFDMAFEIRELDLRRETLLGSKVLSLKSMMKLPGGFGAVVFDRSRERTTAVERTLELIAWRDGFSLNMQIDGDDGSFSRNQKDPLPTTTPEKLAKLMSVFERTHGRADHELPQEQGTCFANGFVRGAPTDEEDVVVHYLYRDAPDGGLTIFHQSDIGTADTTLLERGAAIERNLETVGGKTLRRGKVELAALKAEEYLLQRPKEGPARLMMYDFTLETGSKTGNAASPLFILGFHSGMDPPEQPDLTLDQKASRKPLAKPAFSEAESIAIWDKVSRTLRVRPGAF